MHYREELSVAEALHGLVDPSRQKKDSPQQVINVVNSQVSCCYYSCPWDFTNASASACFTTTCVNNAPLHDNHRSTPLWTC